MAYWKINYNYNLDLNEPELIELITSIKCYCDIIKDIPVGYGLKSEITDEKIPYNRVAGTLKDEIILKDIHGTTAIEGNVLNIQEVGAVLKNRNPRTVQEKEILNMRNIRDYIEKTSVKKHNGDITKELAETLNSIILYDIYEDGVETGKYRTHNVIVGKNHRPPGFEEVSSEMRRFFKFINSEEIKGLNPLIRAVMAHFYFVSIHPFGNGNGRTARALEAYLFYCGGFNVHGFYSLNNYYYKNYPEYFKALDEARFKYKGCLQEFIKFALRGYLSEVKEIAVKVKQFTLDKQFESYVNELFDDNTITARQKSLLGYIKLLNRKLTKQQILKNPVIQGFYNETYSEIESDLEVLFGEKLIKADNDYIIINLDVMKQFTI